MLFSKKCPWCKNDSYKVIYYFFPVRVCKNGKCNCMFGFWCFFTDFLPSSSYSYVYSGSYFIALYNLLMDK